MDDDTELVLQDIAKKFEAIQNLEKQLEVENSVLDETEESLKEVKAANRGDLYIEEGRRDLNEAADFFKLEHGNPPDNGIEIALHDLPQLSQSLQGLKRDRVNAHPVYEEASKFLKETKAACDSARINPQAKKDKVTKAFIKEMQEYCKTKVDQYRMGFHSYAYKKYPLGMKSSSLRDVYIYYVLKKHVGYEGPLYIEENNTEQIVTANILGIEHTTIDRIESVLEDIADNAQRIKRFRKDLNDAIRELEEAEKKVEETKRACGVACTQYRSLRDETIKLKSRIGSLEEHVMGLAYHHQDNISAYASRQHPMGILCSSVMDVHKFYLLMKYGDYNGSLFIEEGGSQKLIDAAMFLELEHTNPNENVADFTPLDHDRELENAFYDFTHYSEDIQASSKNLVDKRTKLEEAKATFDTAKAEYLDANEEYTRVKKQVTETENSVNEMKAFCVSLAKSLN